MSLGRPSRDVVDDKGRLFQCLEGLYEAVNSNRTSITELSNRFISVTDASTTINVGAVASNAVSPLDGGGGQDSAALDGPMPGSSPSTNMARVWVSTPDPSVPYGVNIGALTTGILQHTVTAGVSVPGIVTIGAGLTYASPTLDRAALTGDITAAAGSNTTAFRSFSARSVLANATAGAAVPTELSSGTDGFVLRQSGTTLSFGTLGASSIPALDATFITQTPNANLANEQALSALSSGVLSSITATGVVAATAFTSTCLAFGSGINGKLTEDARLTFSATGGPFSSPTLTISASTGDLIPGFVVYTTSTGTGAAAIARIGNNSSLATQYLQFGQFGTNWTPAGVLVAGTSLVEHVGTSGTLVVSSYDTDIIFTSGTIRAERMRIAVGGNVSIANLTAGGVTYATAATGVLKIGTSAEVASAITWPAAGRILYSSGTTTAPAGNAAFLFDTGDDVVEVGVGIEQAWYNLGSLGTGNYERVRARWSSNIWELLSEKGGTGTVRGMTVNASTATLTLSGNSVDVNGTTGAQVGYLAGVRSTPAVLIGATTSVTIVAGATSPNPSATFTATRLTVDSSVPSIASASGATWDGLKVTGAATLTGAATTLVYNSTTFAIPTITGNGAGGTVNEAATVYIAGPPTPSALTLNFPYALWIDAGISRFDGDGSAYVFELPADATGNVSAATGRIKCVIGGATKYIRYYND